MEGQGQHEYHYGKQYSELYHVGHQHCKEASRYGVGKGYDSENSQSPPDAQVACSRISGHSCRGEEAAVRNFDQRAHHHGHRVEGDCRVYASAYDSRNGVETDRVMSESHCEEFSRGFDFQTAPFSGDPFSDYQGDHSEAERHHRGDQSGLVGDAAPHHEGACREYGHIRGNA